MAGSMVKHRSFFAPIAFADSHLLALFQVVLFLLGKCGWRLIYKEYARQLMDKVTQFHSKLDQP